MEHIPAWLMPPALTQKCLTAACVNKDSLEMDAVVQVLFS